MPNRTLKQLRLAHAWHCASSAKEELGGNYDDYVNAVKNLPAQIRGNGLGQALAHLVAECSDAPEGHLYRHVESWLTDRAELEDAGAVEEDSEGTYADRPDDEEDEAQTPLIYRITQSDSVRYRRGMAEALDYLSVLCDTAGAVKAGPFEASEGDSDGHDDERASSSGETFSETNAP